MRAQEKAEGGTGAQRVLSTSAGHSLSPDAQAELRALAAAGKPSSPAQSLPCGVAVPNFPAAEAAGPSEAASGVAAATGSPEKAARCSAAAQPPAVPGLPPVRSSLAAAQTTAPPVAHGGEPRLSATAPHVPMLRDVGAPLNNCSQAAPVMGAPELPAASHGLPALKTGPRREARRRLAFQPAASDVADSGNMDGVQSLRRTVAISSDLATLTAGGGGLVRSRSL